MDITATIDIESLASRCVDRPRGPIFTLRDQQQAEFSGLCRDSAVLITGAAGFIAQETLKHVLAAEPRVIYLLDSSENGLAALARTLVTRRPEDHPTEVHMVLADISSPLLDRALSQMGELDLVLHFAAVKHVRSERDPASALRILDVNVRGTGRLLNALVCSGRLPRVFAVSTDKAASPTSLMGASKLVMESLLWAYPGIATSARFANVLFSSGSITESWLGRMAAGEPISAPIDTHRYFVTPWESGLICANAIVAPNRSIAVPAPGTITPTDLVQLAGRFLCAFDMQPVHITLEEWEHDPRSAAPTAFSTGKYPVVCTPRDTVGEKQQEVFLGPFDLLAPWTEDIALLSERTAADISSLILKLDQWISDSSIGVSVADVRGALALVVPGFTGTGSETNLDNRI